MGSRGVINLPIVYGGMNNVLSDDKIGNNQAVKLENVTYDETLKKFYGSHTFTDFSSIISNKKLIKLYEVIYNKEKNIFALTDTGIFNISKNKDINISTTGTDIVYNEDGLYFCSENKLYEYKDDTVNDIFHNNIFLSIENVFDTGESYRQPIVYKNILFCSVSNVLCSYHDLDSGDLSKVTRKDYINTGTDTNYYFIVNNQLYFYTTAHNNLRCGKYINGYFLDPCSDTVASECYNNFKYVSDRRLPYGQSDSDNYFIKDSSYLVFSYYNDIPALMRTRNSNYPFNCRFRTVLSEEYETLVPKYILHTSNGATSEFLNNFTYTKIFSSTGKQYKLSISCIYVSNAYGSPLTDSNIFITCYIDKGNGYNFLNSFRIYYEHDKPVQAFYSDALKIYQVSDSELVLFGLYKIYKINIFPDPLNLDTPSFKPEELYLNYISGAGYIGCSSYDEVSRTFYFKYASNTGWIYKFKYITNHDKIPFLLINNSRLIVAQTSMLLFSGVGDFNNWITNTDADALFCEIGYKDSGKIIAGAICYGAIIIFKDNGYIYKLTGDYPNWNVVKIAETDTLTSNLFNYCGSLIFGTKTGIKQLNPSQYYGDFIISDFQNTVIMNDVISISMSEIRKTLIFCSKEYVYEYNINLKIFYIYQAKVYNQILEFFNKSTNSYNYHAIDSNGKYYQSSDVKNNITVKRALIQNNQDIVIKSITLFTDVLLKDTEITIYLYDDVSFKRVLKKGLSKHKILLTKRLRQLQIKYIHAGDVFIEDTIIEYETLKGV